MYNYFNSYILSMFKDYEFIDDKTIQQDEIIEFTATGFTFAITHQDPNYLLAQKCLASSAKTFMNEKKEEYLFFEPRLVIKPQNSSMSVLIYCVRREKYEKIIKELCK